MSDDELNNEARDAKGRWRPGHCPNPRGRPKKQLPAIVDDADISMFRKGGVTLTIGGEKRTMTREAALMHKLYEGAMQGKVSNMRMLQRMLEESDERLANLINYYTKMAADRRHKRNGWEDDADPDLKAEKESLFYDLEANLHQHYPNEYPCPRPQGYYCGICPPDEDASGVELKRLLEKAKALAAKGRKVKQDA